MSFADLLNRDVTVYHRSVTGTDDTGNPIVEFVEMAVVKGWVEQETSTEELGDRDTVIADWLFILPGATVVEAYDRLGYEGKTFEVVGRPAEAMTPEGSHHLELKARWLEG